MYEFDLHSVTKRNILIIDILNTLSVELSGFDKDTSLELLLVEREGLDLWTLR